MFWRRKPRSIVGIEPNRNFKTPHDSKSTTKNEETRNPIGELEPEVEKPIPHDNIRDIAFSENENSDDSPLEEVRAVVPNTDDPDMPCSTFRAWAVGIIFVFLGSGINIFFSLRYPRSVD